MIIYSGAIEQLQIQSTGLSSIVVAWRDLFALGRFRLDGVAL